MTASSPSAEPSRPADARRGLTRIPGTRVLLAALALLACAWFALGIHQTDDLAAADHIAAAPHPSPARIRHAEALLSSARVLNPDQTVAVTRAQLALDAGADARARAILGSVVRSEPDNLDAWIELVRASTHDPREREIAFAHALTLSATRLATARR